MPDSTPHTIRIVHRYDDALAYMDGDKTRWESGRSIAEAIGKLIITRQADYGITIRDEEGRTL